MPKKHRLTGAEIRRLKPEKRLISSLFSLSVTRSESPDTRVACVVSKKVSTKAVVRNSVKRRMRSVLSVLPLPTHASLILTAKSPASLASFTEIRTDIEGLLGKFRGGKQ